MASATWLLVLILTYRAKNDFKAPSSKVDKNSTLGYGDARTSSGEEYPTEFWQEDRYFPDEPILSSPPPYYLYNYSTQASLEMVQPSPSGGGSFDQRSKRNSCSGWIDNRTLRDFL